MGHRGSTKRRVEFSPNTDDLDNSIPHFPRPPSSRPSISVVASAAQLGDFDRRRHASLGSFPLHPRHRPSSSSASDNPQFPLISAADDDSVGGQALLREFLTFLDLKGSDAAHALLLVTAMDCILN